MFPYKEMNKRLREEVVATELYDLYRLVDIETHLVHSYPEGSEEPQPTDKTCHHIWGSDGPCANCTSRLCVSRHEGIMKIEFLNGQVLFIYSTPVDFAGKTWALELIKDVTHSFVVPNADRQDNMEITHMIRQFNDLAVRDTFTRLFNKPYTLNKLASIIDDAEEAAAAGEDAPALPPAVVMLDIDFYKTVNDLYGHNMGDHVLLHVSRALEAYAGTLQDGWCARFGGDEFTIGAPYGLSEKDLQRLENALDELHAYRFNFEGKLFSIVLSKGIAYLKPGDTPRSLLGRADEAMYAEKLEHHAQVSK